jgi:hypothetical protein
MEPSQELEPLLKISLVLQGEIARKFEAIKRRFGFESNTDLFRLLISQKYDEMFSATRPPVIRQQTMLDRQ